MVVGLVLVPVVDDLVRSNPPPQLLFSDQDVLVYVACGVSPRVMAHLCYSNISVFIDKPQAPGWLAGPSPALAAVAAPFCVPVCRYAFRSAALNAGRRPVRDHWVPGL